MIRKGFFILTTVILIVAVFAGIVNALDTTPATVVKANLENVGSYVTAGHASGINYAVDNGELFAGQPGEWRKVETPQSVIAGAVAVSSADPRMIYLGAANEMAIYRSQDRGISWMRVPLGHEYIGGVTSLAVDEMNRLLYVGTDSAGVFRLRDVGSSMIVGGHTAFEDGVKELAIDKTGAGLLFVRTTKDLFQAENGGLEWQKVENLGSTPTAVVIVDSYPATVYVGTIDRGLLASHDGESWTMANDGLGLVPGSRLQIDALATDPAQLDVLYVATSFIYGTSGYHQSPVGVAMSTNGGASWTPLASDTQNVVAELLPVAGQTGGVYALTTTSRMPQPLGSAPVIAEPAQLVEAPTAQPINAGLAAWIVATLAGLALLFAFMTDTARRSRRIAQARAESQRKALQTQTVSTVR